jgi:hypothetical protein
VYNRLTELPNCLFFLKKKVKDRFVIGINIKECMKHGDINFMCACHAKSGKRGKEVIAWEKMQ